MRSLASRWEVIYPRVVLFKDWYKVVSPTNRFYKKSFTIHLRNGEAFEVRDAFCSDISIIIDLYYDKEYWLEGFPIPEDAVVLDMGANIGAFANCVLHFFPAAQVYAYEAEPENFKLLKKNAPKAHSFESAVTGKEGDIDLYLNVDTTGHTLVRGNVNPKLKNVVSVKVKGISLQSILEKFEKVDILKLDIEGSEYEALLATSPEQLKKVKNLFVEIHSSWSGKTTEDLLNHLFDSGFKIQKQFAEVYWLVQ